jgi:hypothetical protein
LWPRVEIFPSFVFWKLRRILYFGQNRVESYLARPDPSQKLLWASRVEIVLAGSNPSQRSLWASRIEMAGLRDRLWAFSKVDFELEKRGGGERLSAETRNS